MNFNAFNASQQTPQSNPWLPREGVVPILIHGRLVLVSQADLMNPATLQLLAAQGAVMVPPAVPFPQQPIALPQQQQQQPTTGPLTTQPLPTTAPISHPMIPTPTPTETATPAPAPAPAPASTSTPTSGVGTRKRKRKVKGEAKDTDYKPQAVNQTVSANTIGGGSGTNSGYQLRSRKAKPEPIVVPDTATSTTRKTTTTTNRKQTTKGKSKAVKPETTVSGSSDKQSNTRVVIDIDDTVTLSATKPEPLRSNDVIVVSNQTVSNQQSVAAVQNVATKAENSQTVASTSIKPAVESTTATPTSARKKRTMFAVDDPEIDLLLEINDRTPTSSTSSPTVSLPSSSTLSRIADDQKPPIDIYNVDDDPTVNNGNENDDDDAQLTDIPTEDYIGRIKATLVGMQHYEGIVTPGELVTIVREPLNEHDPNAIAVYNITKEQIGHIEHKRAECLAPLIDSQRFTRLDAVIHKQKAQYQQRIHLYAFAKPEDRESIAQHLQRYGLYLDTAAAVPEVLRLFDPNQSIQSANDVNRVLDAAMSGILDRINVRPESLLDIPLDHLEIEPAEQPIGLKTKLHTHQRRALAWMLQRESNDTDPASNGRRSLFWERRNDGLWFNTITRSVVHTPPPEARGGLLADDMGLGKTLEVISLLVSTKATVGCTLVVTPVSTIYNWQEQCRRHAGYNKLKVHTYHGSGRKKLDIEELVDFDVVITTYSVLAADYRPGTRNQSSPLFQHHWERIVLDEAHTIKSIKAQQTQAVLALHGVRKWCLTGTPIQNKITDLFPLLKFIGVEPFTEFAWWRRLIERPLKNGDPEGHKRLKATLQLMCMRRTKALQCSLPPIETKIVSLEFSAADRAYYDSIFLKGRRTFTSYFNDGTVMRNYAHVLTILLRLRQVCDDKRLYSRPIGIELDANIEIDEDIAQRMSTALKMIETGDLDECCICFTRLTQQISPVITKNCAHVFCRDCIIQSLMTTLGKCPLCRTPIIMATDLHPISMPSSLLTVSEQQNALVPKAETSASAANSPIKTDVANSIKGTKSETLGSGLQESIHGAKITALVNDLLYLKGIDPFLKAVVFSQFTSFMDLIQEAFHAAGIKHVRLDGSMNSQQRQDTLRRFDSDHTVSVFLISLKAGGLGLNLTNAYRVYMMDPWWNPAVEEQAIDRVHRIGQTHTVSVTRYVMKDSVEERILELQERKKQMIAEALEVRSKEELQKMRVEDLALLFGIR